MNATGTSVYAFSIIVLFLKFFATITIQARERLRTRYFRHPEDAAYWSGQVGADSELCERAQGLLRNDAESQVFFMPIGALYVSLGAWPPGTCYYFTLYVASRLLHGYFFLRGRQPYRNRAFSLGLLVLFIMSAHIVIHAAPGIGR